MEIRFTQSARKHRIGKARAIFVIRTNDPEIIYSLDKGRNHLVWIGKDNRGLELEIIGIEQENYVMIIHVMPKMFRRGKR